MSYQEELAAMLDPDMIFFDKLTHSQVHFPLPVWPFTFTWRALTPGEHAHTYHTTRHDIKENARGGEPHDEPRAVGLRRLGALAPPHR